MESKRLSGLGSAIFIAMLSAFFFASATYAMELKEEDLKVEGYVDNGRFQLKDTIKNGEIVSRMGSKWSFNKPMDEHWLVMAKLHWMFWRNEATDLALFHIAGLKFDADLEGAISYQNGVNGIKFGLYEFKYNPDSKNLGEYLLRSEAYPTIIENSQGKDLLTYSSSRIAGLQYNLNFPLFRQTALIYAEQYSVPVNDVSLAYLAAIGTEHAELQFGAALHRQFRFGKPIKVTSLDQYRKDYIQSQGLSTQAIKLSLRAHLDVEILSRREQNFTLYGEAALLGLKNDSLFYKKPMQRLPIMVGVDIPTGEFLNVLSIETEYFKNPYYDRKYPSADASGSNFSPLPSLSSDEYTGGRIPNFTKDDWKWSIFANKKLNNWIDVKGRVASDHLRLRSWDGDLGGLPLTQGLGDFYFLLQIEYHN